MQGWSLKLFYLLYINFWFDSWIYYKFLEENKDSNHFRYYFVFDFGNNMCAHKTIVCIIFLQNNFHLYHYAGNNPIRYTDPDGRDIGDWQDNGDGTWTVISEGATLWDVWGSDAYKVTGLSKSVKKSLKEIFLKDPSILTKLQKALMLNKENIIIMIGEEAYQFFSDLVLTKDAGKSFVEYYGY